jgi:hypothetical protein
MVQIQIDGSDAKLLLVVINVIDIVKKIGPELRSHGHSHKVLLVPSNLIDIKAINVNAKAVLGI